MRVVIDANIAISATIQRLGNPNTIMRRWDGGAFVWITSEVLLNELARSLNYQRVRRRNLWTEEQTAVYVARIREKVILVDPSRQVDVLEGDPDDNRLLEAAVAGEADYIVTGDGLLIELAEFEGIRIVTPSRFVAILNDAG